MNREAWAASAEPHPTARTLPQSCVEVAAQPVVLYPDGVHGPVLLIGRGGDEDSLRVPGLEVAAEAVEPVDDGLELRGKAAEVVRSDEHDHVRGHDLGAHLRHVVLLDARTGRPAGVTGAAHADAEAHDLDDVDRVTGLPGAIHEPVRDCTRRTLQVRTSLNDCDLHGDRRFDSCSSYLTLNDCERSLSREKTDPVNLCGGRRPTRT